MISCGKLSDQSSYFLHIIWKLKTFKEILKAEDYILVSKVHPSWVGTKYLSTEETIIFNQSKKSLYVVFENIFFFQGKDYNR